MGILSWVVMGLVVGVLAKVIMPGKDPGGVIITPGPIEDYVPIERSPKGVPIVQWEKDGVEEAGLVKIDLLGNRSLGVIRDAIRNLKANGEILDETRWEPEDDPATLLQRLDSAELEHALAEHADTRAALSDGESLLDAIEGEEGADVEGQEHGDLGVGREQQFLFENEQIAVQFRHLLFDGL